MKLEILGTVTSAHIGLAPASQLGHVVRDALAVSQQIDARRVTFEEIGMKAIVYHKYGHPEVLELQEMGKPNVEDDELLIKVHAASVNPLDWHFLRGTPFFIRLIAGLFKPKHKILGVDVAGRVETIGRNVKQFQPGDEVFGGVSRGAYAEYVSVCEDGIVIKPARITFEEAAAVPVAAFTALQGLRDKGQIQAGQNILINGASGGVGTFAVQIAKSFGAEVTGVCSTRNLEMVRSIGADHVIDYTKEDFTHNRQCYDLFLDAVGNRSLSDCMRLLSSDGIYVAVAGSIPRALRISMTRGKKMVTFIAKTNKTDLVFLRELLESGKVKPVIDRSYTLSEVPEAIGYVEKGHAQGKVIITM